MWVVHIMIWAVHEEGRFFQTGRHKQHKLLRNGVSQGHDMARIRDVESVGNSKWVKNVCCSHVHGHVKNPSLPQIHGEKER